MVFLLVFFCSKVLVRNAQWCECLGCPLMRVPRLPTDVSASAAHWCECTKNTLHSSQLLSTQTQFFFAYRCTSSFASCFGCRVFSLDFCCTLYRTVVPSRSNYRKNGPQTKARGRKRVCTKAIRSQAEARGRENLPYELRKHISFFSKSLSTPTLFFFAGRCTSSFASWFSYGVCFVFWCSFTNLFKFSGHGQREVSQQNGWMNSEEEKAWQNTSKIVGWILKVKKKQKRRCANTTHTIFCYVFTRTNNENDSKNHDWS